MILKDRFLKLRSLTACPAQIFPHLDYDRNSWGEAKGEGVKVLLPSS